MGRIKSTAIKTLARDLLEEHKGEFSADFEKNKTEINSVRPIASKKIRNILAGYIAKDIKKSTRKAEVVKRVREPAREAGEGVR